MGSYTPEEKAEEYAAGYTKNRNQWIALGAWLAGYRARDEETGDGCSAILGKLSTNPNIDKSPNISDEETKVQSNPPPVKGARIDGEAAELFSEERGNLANGVYDRECQESFMAGSRHGRQAERDRAQVLVKALENIFRKDPNKVSREEAADMACEFRIFVLEALAQFRGTQ